MRVFVSAAREARPYALAALIAGFEAETDGAALRFEAVLVGPEASGSVSLEARPAGDTYRGLPWWEARISGARFCGVCGAWVDLNECRRDARHDWARP